ncbi:MAG: hypothetical protein ONB46_25115 [candidate division KSB1 bacterium]|nr:hypothetical protein [candidate division KSB1 bacterium]MDZ7369189.1 hypothetical protein [candidate division KSB1 bacterium]MDZ7407186.1 hypothetical protein [candidate division KSB1 bacterium]
MQPSPLPISLLRYLIAWKVNSSLVTLPEYLPVELSLVLGSIISNRLATQEAGPWRKAIMPLAEYHAQTSGKNKKVTMPFPAVSWPIEAVLLAYPAKQTFGFGELIFWELKLLGESADHGLFLELILPAMEEAGYTADAQWHRTKGLWGHFEVSAIYVAHGKTWAPIVEQGKLDLRYRPTPVQWAEGLTFKPEPPRRFYSLNWLTPFDLAGIPSGENTNRDAEKPQETLQIILEALVDRAGRLITGRQNPREAVTAVLTADEQAALQNAMAEAAKVNCLYKNLDRMPKHLPGAWRGAHTYAPIPASIIPYLELASILHIGKHTHFGCGTFQLG